MSFILGLFFGYCIRGKKRLLIATLTVIAVVARMEAAEKKSPAARPRRIPTVRCPSLRRP
jgi:hypothetical protein